LIARRHIASLHGQQNGKTRNAGLKGRRYGQIDHDGFGWVSCLMVIHMNLRGTSYRFAILNRVDSI